jgi:streptogramin lyase
VVLPGHAKVTPPPPQAGVTEGPDRPYALAADRHSLWVVGELTLYRYDLATGRLTARVRLPGLAVALTSGVLWAANLIEGPTFIYGIDARSASITSKRPGDTEIVAMAAGAGAVWAVSHDRATLLRIDPSSGRMAHRIRLASDPHGVAFGSGFVWVALYHQSTIIRVDPHTNRILGPPIAAGFPTEPLASAGGHLWAIPSVGGSLADPQLHTVLEIDAASGRIVGSYQTRGRPHDIVAAGNSVWVATTEPNELVRFPSSATR